MGPATLVGANAKSWSGAASQVDHVAWPSGLEAGDLVFLRTHAAGTEWETAGLTVTDARIAGAPLPFYQVPAGFDGSVPLEVTLTTGGTMTAVCALAAYRVPEITGTLKTFASGDIFSWRVKPYLDSVGGSLVWPLWPYDGTAKDLALGLGGCPITGPVLTDEEWDASPVFIGAGWIASDGSWSFGSVDGQDWGQTVAGTAQPPLYHWPVNLGDVVFHYNGSSPTIDIPPVLLTWTPRSGYGYYGAVGYTFLPPVTTAPILASVKDPFGGRWVSPGSGKIHQQDGIGEAFVPRSVPFRGSHDLARMECGILVATTPDGRFASMDDGDTWQSLT